MKRTGVIAVFELPLLAATSKLIKETSDERRRKIAVFPRSTHERGLFLNLGRGRRVRLLEMRLVIGESKPSRRLASIKLSKKSTTADMSMEECYICTESVPTLLSDICNCKTRFLHTNCQRMHSMVSISGVRCFFLIQSRWTQCFLARAFFP